jgi:hypothetical protein
LSAGDGGQVGDVIVEVRGLSENDIAEFEVVNEPSMGYREWCIPAEFLNTNASVTIIEDNTVVAQDDAGRETARCGTMSR